MKLATEEEQLARAVKAVGPLVALGRPEDSLPVLGALRVYVEEAAWRRTVAHWLIHARLVLLRLAGPTDNLLWELELASQVTQPERLVLLVMLKRGAYQRLRVSVQHAFPRGLPDYEERFYDVVRGHALFGLVYFDRDWTPRFVRIRPLLLALGPVHLVTNVLRPALKPVLAQLHVAPSHRLGRLWPWRRAAA